MYQIKNYTKAHKNIYVSHIYFSVRRKEEKKNQWDENSDREPRTDREVNKKTRSKMKIEEKSIKSVKQKNGCWTLFPINSGLLTIFFVDAW